MKRQFLLLCSLILLVIVACNKEIKSPQAPRGGEILMDIMPPLPELTSWKSESDVPSHARYGAYAFALGGSGYLGGGFANSPNGMDSQKDLWKFDTATGVWSQMANLPGYSRGYAVTFDISGKGYVATGQFYNDKPTGPDESFFLRDTWRYDPVTNSWLSRSSLPPGNSRRVAVGMAINGKGYVGTGEGSGINSELDDWWQYNPTTDTWSQKADFPGGKRKGATGFAYNGRGYLGTGISFDPSITFYNDFWQYNSNADTWTQKASMPSAGRQNAVGLSANDKGFVITGQSQSGYLDEVWQFENATNQWTQKIKVLGGGKRHAAGFSIGSFLFVGTGSKEYPASEFSSDFWSLKLN